MVTNVSEYGMILVRYAKCVSKQTESKSKEKL